MEEVIRIQMFFTALPLAFAAMAQAVIVISGGIDLSLGSVLGFAGVLVGGGVFELRRQFGLLGFEFDEEVHAVLQRVGQSLERSPGEIIGRIGAWNTTGAIAGSLARP